MKTPTIIGLQIFGIFLFSGSIKAHAEWKVLPEKETPSIFAGEKREIHIVVTNPGNQTVNTEARTRIYQTSTTTAVRLSETSWKHLQLLPGQTVIESALLTFPSVNAETHFVVQWLEGTNTVHGTTEVCVYPQNLLKELRSLAQDEPLGLLDPDNQLKPLLKEISLEFVDLEESDISNYHGKLAILGPFASSESMKNGLGGRIRTMAGAGTAVVYIQPPGNEEDLKPSFYPVTVGNGLVIIAQSRLTEHLAENPQSQMNLIGLCRFALRRTELALPFTTPDP